MRTLTTVLLTLLCVAPAAAQQNVQNVTIRLDFDTGEDNAGSAFLAVLPASRAWSDSVSVFFNDQLRQKAPPNLMRSQNDPAPTYRLFIQPLPVMKADNKPSGLTTYSLVLFRIARTPARWEYVASSVGYNTKAQEAAGEILDWAIAIMRR